MTYLCVTGRFSGLPAAAHLCRFRAAFVFVSALPTDGEVIMLLDFRPALLRSKTTAMPITFRLADSSFPKTPLFRVSFCAFLFPIYRQLYYSTAEIKILVSPHVLFSATVMDGTNEKKKNRVKLNQIKVENHTNVPSTKDRIERGGKMGAVYDPNFLSNFPRNFTIIKEERMICANPGNGIEGEEGYSDLKRIRKYISDVKPRRNVKVFCAVYTYSGHVKMTDAISETWGKRCDGLLYASDITNSKSGHFQIPTNSRHGFGYRGMIQRTRSILAYLYDNYLNDYDFFHISGDDVYLIIENLKEFLVSKRIQEWEATEGQYIYAGFWLTGFHWNNTKLHKKYFFLGGGSGYTISRKGLKAFVEGPLQTCDPYQDDSYEDIWFSDCARMVSNKFVYTGDSNGGQRYHQGPISNTLNFHLFAKSIKLASELTGITSALENGNNIVANASIAFHNHHHPNELRRYELLLYRDFEDHCRETAA